MSGGAGIPCSQTVAYRTSTVPTDTTVSRRSVVCKLTEHIRVTTTAFQASCGTGIYSAVTSISGGGDASTSALTQQTNLAAGGNFELLIEQEWVFAQATTTATTYTAALFQALTPYGIAGAAGCIPVGNYTVNHVATAFRCQSVADQ